MASDAIIAAAYFSIPFVLWRLLKARPDIEFGWMVGLFATFILACGTTHLFNIYVLWVPAYGIEAAIKALTAVSSIGTALLLLPLLPKLIALPSPAQLQAVNDQLVLESAERERTAEMLRQSQKLEVIGRITGGVAHDFNNLLQIVMGNIERAERLAAGSNPAVTKALANAAVGAQRAAELTDQLLAFARRQPLTTVTASLNALIEETMPLVERASGETVILDYSPHADDPCVKVDRTQFQNALLNLALNARDAMPDGGCLTISVHEDESPDCIELRVSDTGTGMDAETLEQSTEPFFTTKPIGSGTGLGLSQVLGMVEQIGGSLKIESGRGTGTRVRLFLPCGVAEANAEVG
ncbi:sensor histidine kinase [Novosphingobium aquae]|uniref:histidine kinase n=1 Tax=Novosphingobium aquae TaxID=3133435 RepID=A0ABU8SB45_9SPHN